ncbi:MAG: hypothetical protein ACPL3P_03495 [Anaerolineales bacterium]
MHWRVQHASTVLLNNKPMSASGDQKVCPSETSGYDLLARSPLGDVLREITIVVSVPQDTTPPPIPTPIQPGNTSENNPPTSACIPLQWQGVSDPSGLYYIVELQKKVGNTWNQEIIWIGVSTTSQDMGYHCKSGWHYRWHVRAKDNAGNLSDWSTWFYFNTPIL